MTCNYTESFIVVMVSTKSLHLSCSVYNCLHKRKGGQYAPEERQEQEEN